MSETVGLAHASGPEGMRLYAVGDVHGRCDLLDAMHARIEEDIATSEPPDWRVIHLGDYVDRGPDSRGVIDRLVAWQRRDSRVLTLAGNHDVAFLEFLQAPAMSGLFATYGGAQAAASYGVAMQFADEPAFLREHERLVAAVPPEHLEFLLSLRFSAAFGDFFFCHAGIRPAVPLDKQSLDDLIWIRADFLDAEALHPKVIVHGHTPCRSAELRANRINLDTGAFRSGVLSGLIIDGKNKKIVEVRG